MDGDRTFSPVRGPPDRGIRFANLDSLDHAKTDPPFRAYFPYKKLVGTSASLLVRSALLLVTRS